MKIWKNYGIGVDEAYADRHGRQPVEMLLPKKQNKFLLYFNRRRTLENRLGKLECITNLLNEATPKILDELTKYCENFGKVEEGILCGEDTKQYREGERNAYSEMEKLTASVREKVRANFEDITISTPENSIWAKNGHLSVRRMVTYWTELRKRFDENRTTLENHLKN